MKLRVKLPYTTLLHIISCMASGEVTSHEVCLTGTDTGFVEGGTQYQHLTV